MEATYRDPVFAERLAPRCAELEQLFRSLYGDPLNSTISNRSWLKRTPTGQPTSNASTPPVNTIRNGTVAATCSA